MSAEVDHKLEEFGEISVYQAAQDFLKAALGNDDFLEAIKTLASTCPLSQNPQDSALYTRYFYESPYDVNTLSFAGGIEETSLENHTLLIKSLINIVHNEFLNAEKNRSSVHGFNQKTTNMDTFKIAVCDAISKSFKIAEIRRNKIEINRSDAVIGATRAVFALKVYP